MKRVIGIMLIGIALAGCFGRDDGPPSTADRMAAMIEADAEIVRSRTPVSDIWIKLDRDPYNPWDGQEILSGAIRYRINYPDGSTLYVKELNNSTFDYVQAVD